MMELEHATRHTPLEKVGFKGPHVDISFDYTMSTHSPPSSTEVKE